MTSTVLKNKFFQHFLIDTTCNSLLVGLALFCIPSEVCKADDWSSEMLFLAGYNDYLNSDYASCADHLYAAINEEVELESRARLYLSFCQMKLGYLDAATYNYTQLNENELTRADQRVQQIVKRVLRKGIENARSFHIWLGLYTGVTFYNSIGAQATYVGTAPVTGYGAVANLQKQGWTLFLSGMNYRYTASSTAEAASQGLLGIQKMITPSWALWAQGIFLRGQPTSPNNTLGGGAGINWYATSDLHFKVNYFYTNYPYLAYSPLNVSQITGSLRWNLYHQGSDLLTIEIGSQTVFPTAATRSSSPINSTLNPTYQRSYANLIAQSREISLNLGAWTGKEAFGVRNEGSIILSTLNGSDYIEEHRYGWNAGLTITPHPTWGFELLFSQERIATSISEFDTRSAFGGLFFNL